VRAARLALLALPAAALAVPPGAGAATPAAPPAAAARHFLDAYATADGRVVRRGDGGDVVSEGQAYGLLLAEVAGRPATARRIWEWTRAHLLRSNGLPAWHATADGTVLDPQSASDADVLLAWGLLRYAGPGAAGLHAEGRALAAAVLAHETAPVPGGGLVVVAGPWALGGSRPTVDPSYLMPGVFAALARLTGDARWAAAAGSAVTLVQGATAGGSRLPPDWALLDGTSLVPAAAPGGGSPVQYGPDAARLPLWFATACADQPRALAARWWTAVLSRPGRSGSQALTLAGQVLQPASGPLPLLTSAASARAAGEGRTSRGLLIRAAGEARRQPSYYGDAWAALGPALLARSLDQCG
jgi:endoglucanase